MEVNIGEIVLEDELDFGEIELDVIKELPELEDLIVTPSSSEQKFKSSKYGYDNVTVKPVESEELSIIPSAEEQVKEGMFNKVTVAGDSDLIPKNIKKGTEIFGVTGTAKVTDLKITDARYLFTNGVRLSILNELLTICEDVTYSSYMFQNCSGLTELDLSNFNTSKVTNMAYMFQNCSNLTVLDLSNFNTSKVTNMAYMFYNCSKLENLDLSNFNTSNVTNMIYMFNGCSKLKNLDLSGFSINKTKDMSRMFQNCSNLTVLDLSNFNTSNVTNMTYMFYNCSNLTELDFSNFNTNKITDMSRMFYNCSKLENLDLSNFDATNIVYIDYIFDSCNKLTNLKCFKNLGKGYTSKNNNYTFYKLNLSSCTLLTHESLMNVINNLYDLNLTYNVASGGTLYTQTLSLGSTNKAKLTEEEIAIATSKGWNIT